MRKLEKAFGFLLVFFMGTLSGELICREKAGAEPTLNKQDTKLIKTKPSATRTEKTKMAVEPLPGATQFFYARSAAELRTIIGAADKPAAILAGTNSPGDGGGGTFYWDDKVWYDDGGTVFRTGKSPIQRGGWRRLRCGKTYNAAWFIGATKEVQIDSAIIQAADAGMERIFVPSTMLPYDATAVSFNPAIHMVREGSDPNVWDVRAYGAKGRNDSNEDDTIAIQKAIDGADWHTHPSGDTRFGEVYFPPGNYYITNLKLPNDIILKGDGWRYVTLRACQHTKGAMLADTGNAMSIQISGLQVDGNKQPDIVGIKLGYQGGLGNNSQFNLLAWLKNIEVCNCVIGVDVYANVAELEDIYADSNQLGMRLAGIAIRATRIACQMSNLRELEVRCRQAKLNDVHIETNIRDGSIIDISDASGVVIDGLSIAIGEPMLTRAILINLGSGTTGCCIRDIVLNLDKTAEFTNLINDAPLGRVIKKSDLSDPRCGGAYYQKDYKIWQ